MKSKPLLYLLGFLVLCIWGLIVYQIYLSVHDETEDSGSGLRTAIAKKISVPKLYPDTFSLLLDYPDPFTGEVSKMRDTAGKKFTGKKIMAPLLPVIPPLNPVTQMKYLGFVSDGKGSNRVAVISYQGTEKMMKEGDTLQKVKVMSIKKNSVILQYQGKLATIKTE